MSGNGYSLSTSRAEAHLTTIAPIWYSMKSKK